MHKRERYCRCWMLLSLISLLSRTSAEQEMRNVNLGSWRMKVLEVNGRVHSYETGKIMWHQWAKKPACLYILQIPVYTFCIPITYIYHLYTQRLYMPPKYQVPIYTTYIPSAGIYQNFLCYAYKHYWSLEIIITLAWKLRTHNRDDPKRVKNVFLKTITQNVHNKNSEGTQSSCLIFFFVRRFFGFLFKESGRERGKVRGRGNQPYLRLSHSENPPIRGNESFLLFL